MPLLLDAALSVHLGWKSLPSYKIKDTVSRFEFTTIPVLVRLESLVSQSLRLEEADLIESRASARDPGTEISGDRDDLESRGLKTSDDKKKFDDSKGLDNNNSML